MLYTDTIIFMLGPVPNVLLIVLHVKQVPMLLFVFYSTMNSLVGKSQLIIKLHSCQNHGQNKLHIFKK